jgi:hypothetical protein
VDADVRRPYNAGAGAARSVLRRRNLRNRRNRSSGRNQPQPAKGGPTLTTPTLPARRRALDAPAPAAFHRRLLVLALVALAVLAAGGCTVRLISDYDETIDQSASQLQKEMDSFLTQMETDQEDAVTYGANRGFYPYYATEVRAVLVRAQAHPKNELTVAQYELMLDSLKELEEAHRGDEGVEDEGTLPVEAIPVFRDLFNQAWSAIIRLEVAKKR